MPKVEPYTSLGPDQKILIELALHTMLFRVPYLDRTLSPTADENERANHLAELTAKVNSLAEQKQITRERLDEMRDATARRMLTAPRAAVNAAARIVQPRVKNPETARLGQEVQAHLVQAYQDGGFPHRLHEAVIARQAVFVDDQGRQHVQPGEYVPVECVMAPEGVELPSLKMDREAQRALRERIEQAIPGIAAAEGQGFRPVAQATIDGVACEIWPFVPEKGQSIPRKSIAGRAFKPFGYKPAPAGHGCLELHRTTADGFAIQVAFDLGTWRRTVIGHLRISKDGLRLLTTPLVYWVPPRTEGNLRDIPILTEPIFRMTMENAAWAAGEVERVFLPRLAEPSAP